MMRTQPTAFRKSRRCALVIGHPGHELRVFGWALQQHPRTYVITNGAGSGGSSRLDVTSSLLKEMDAEADGIFGRISDKELYQEVLSGDISYFCDLLEELTASFIAHEIDCVVGDAAEGFNPAHDLCRYLIDSAVTLVQRRSGRQIDDYEFGLIHMEIGGAEHHDENCVHFELSAAALSAKLRAADRYVGLAKETRTALALYGEDYFRTECLRPVVQTGAFVDPATAPYYETIGEERVQHGVFTTVLRYNNHVRPIRWALNAYAREGN